MFRGRGQGARSRRYAPSTPENPGKSRIPAPRKSFLLFYSFTFLLFSIVFKRPVQSIDDLLPRVIRDNGLETPLLQRRLIDAWEEVAGHIVASYTVEKFIRNQTLMVRISNPALRADLSMMRSQLVIRLNQHVGSMVIADVRFY